MTTSNASEAAKAVVRRNTEEVQGGGNFAVFDELFADDFLDHTPQPGRTPDKAGARELYKVLRAAFPDFHAEIHWQLADGDRVTTYKTYHGTHLGEFFGVAPTGRKIQFETVDVMRVRDGQITEHWGVANLFSLMQQLGALPLDQNRSGRAQPRFKEAPTLKGTSDDHWHHWLGCDRHSLRPDAEPGGCRGDHLKQPRRGFTEGSGPRAWAINTRRAPARKRHAPTSSSWP